MAKARKQTTRTQRAARHDDDNLEDIGIVPQQDPEESRRDKFERLALARMNRALNTIRLLGNLASYNYDWTEADIARMRASILEVTDETFARFQRHRRGAKPVFRFEQENH